MRKLFYLLGFIILLFATCKKDELNKIDEPNAQTNYFPLEIGNYWVYKHFQIDTNGVETELEMTDSIVVSRDTSINNKNYFILEGVDFPNSSQNWGIVSILRDSSGYLVSENGAILFSDNNFTDTLISRTQFVEGDTFYVLSYKMERVFNPVSVPAGIFNVLNFKGSFYMPNPEPGVEKTRYINTYYANNVGKILQTYFYASNPSYMEKRLVNYHVKEAGS
jgi:hypothetical protein